LGKFGRSRGYITRGEDSGRKKKKSVRVKGALDFQGVKRGGPEKREIQGEGSGVKLYGGLKKKACGRQDDFGEKFYGTSMSPRGSISRD